MISLNCLNANHCLSNEKQPQPPPEHTKQTSLEDFPGEYYVPQIDSSSAGPFSYTTGSGRRNIRKNVDKKE